VECGISPITESSVIDTVISVRRGNFGDSTINNGYIAYFSMRMRESMAYFYFRSEIWRHHPVPRPRSPIWRWNSGDSRTFKAEIGIFMFAWIFRICWPKMAVSGGIGEGVVRCWFPTNSFILYLCATFGENRSRNVTPFTRHNLLSNSFDNRFDNWWMCVYTIQPVVKRVVNRIDNRLYRVNGEWECGQTDRLRDRDNVNL